MLEKYTSTRGCRPGLRNRSLSSFRLSLQLLMRLYATSLFSSIAQLPDSILVSEMIGIVTVFARYEGRS